MKHFVIITCYRTTRSYSIDLSYWTPLSVANLSTNQHKSRPVQHNGIVCLWKTLVSREQFDSIVNATGEYPRLCRVKFTVKNSDIISFSWTVTAQYFHRYNQWILHQITANTNIADRCESWLFVCKLLKSFTAMHSWCFRSALHWWMNWMILIRNISHNNKNNTK